MRRLQLFEFNDQPWLPGRLRDFQTDQLAAMVRVGAPFLPIVPLVRAALEHAPAHRIVDLCSGGGGPLLAVLEHLEADGVLPEVVLTDLFPNRRAFSFARARIGPRCDFRSDPVDAARVPRELGGLRTIFNAFHHFPPDTARRVLADAAAAKQPICVVEITERRLAPMAFLLAIPFVALATALRIRPVCWRRLLFTYGIPAVPLLVGFDGVVSCLRTYRPRELLELAPPHPDYVWEAGQTPIPRLPLRLTWLVGRPTARSPHA